MDDCSLSAGIERGMNSLLLSVLLLAGCTRRRTVDGFWIRMNGFLGACWPGEESLLLSGHKRMVESLLLSGY